MIETKYVVFDRCPGNGIEIDTMLIFPTWLEHRTVYEIFLNKYPECYIIAAGFINEAGNVYGESISINMKNRGEKDQILYNLLIKK